MKLWWNEVSTISANNIRNYYTFGGGVGHTLVVLTSFSALWPTQGPHRMLGIEPTSAECMANALPSVLLLRLPILLLFFLLIMNLSKKWIYGIVWRPIVFWWSRNKTRRLLLCSLCKLMADFSRKGTSRKLSSIDLLHPQKPGMVLIDPLVLDGFKDDFSRCGGSKVIKKWWSDYCNHRFTVAFTRQGT